MNSNINQLTAAIYRNLQCIVSSRLKDIPIQCGQHIFFYVLLQREGITQQELSDYLYIGKSTTAKAVKHLITLGLVRKERDNNDKRCERLYVTEEGRKIENRIRETYQDTVEITKRNLSPEEAEQAVALLNRILSSVLEAKCS